MKRILFILSGLLCFTVSYSQGYKINLTMKGEKEQDIIMAIYSGPNTYMFIDTARLDKKGKAEFKANKLLDPGMYLFIMGEKHVLDFLVSDLKKQSFSVTVNKNKYPDAIVFKGSPENEAFVGYSRYLANKQTKEAELMNRVKDSPNDKNLLEKVNAEMKLLSEESENKISEIKSQFPGTLLSSIVSAMNPVKPDEMKIPETGKDNYLYNFYKNHYWDNIPLTDKRIQNTPILINAIDNYFENVLVQTPDSIIAGVKLVLSKAEGDSAMLHFLTGYVYNMYLESDIMGMENVMVYIIDNYYLSGKVEVDDEEFIKEVSDFARKYRETLVGKQAKNLKMEAINGMYESLYDIDSPYTLVYFFEPSCGYCKYETPRVYKVFDKYKDKGLAGFCVYTQDDRNEWASYISKNKLYDWINVWDPKNENNFRIKYSIYSVPQVYLLDKDKTIIGRRLDSELLDKMLKDLLN